MSGNSKKQAAAKVYPAQSLHLASILSFLAWCTVPCWSESIASSSTESSCLDSDGSAIDSATKTLHNGVKIPVFLLGTAQLCMESDDPDAPTGFIGILPERGYRQIQLALEAGVRAFDSALNYGSHEPIRHVLGEWYRTGQLRSRKDAWITTKVFHPHCGVCVSLRHMPTLSVMTAEQAAAATRNHVEQSLMELNVGYVDLMLMHWPGENDKSAEGDGALDSSTDSAPRDKIDPTLARQRRIAAWKVLEEFYEKGWARAIGVSNFSVRHLKELREDGAKIVPMVNQIEASVEVQQVDIRDYCLENNIVLQAFSTLRGLNGPAKQVLEQIGNAHGKDLGQVAFRYLYQHGYTMVFLTNSQARMKSNQDIFDFELSDEEMKQVDELNLPEGGGWGLPRPDDIP
eukprot:CAMPEP_0168721688 /NCGR_PEP_ID=MMETSP0724-20121128/2212_1 /TAXON_ID=265536 /ORGANISM="Amphiprora sp., Strain CCMP467" /LENGTH=400 /DNA_ID=CAMNT_0008768339 /DNA_START=532 /DNA_END=1735 /DNA_ORIENTATION=+